MREHLGPEFLTNFHAETGAFLDPKHALVVPPSVTGAGKRAGVVSPVQDGGQYKAVARSQGRPVLVGLFASRAEAERALADWAAARGLPPDARGGMAVAPKQSRYLGVSWDSYHRRWMARLSYEGKRVLSQVFSEGLEEEAARVYDAHARKYHEAETAVTNFDLDGRFLDPKGRAVRRGAAGAGVDYRGVSFSQEVSKWQAKVTRGVG